MSVVKLIGRLRDEYTAMPGLCLTEEQVQRLCHVSASTSASALRALVSAGFLQSVADGGYRRAGVEFNSRTRSTVGDAKPPWRRILCLVEFEDDSGGAVTAASHSALRYATALAVTHRARVTALHLVPQLPDGPAAQLPFITQAVDDVRSGVRGQRIPELIDIHVVEGSSNQDLLRSASEIGADLIVLGRRDGGVACLSQLREMLRDAPCHVLVVHPSAHAAVA
jgi:nucleotide-binding universal stress UspA family protein